MGVRLREGDDFPYFETRGFSAEFVESENYLCQRDLNDQILRDDLGKPLLDCMCGNILCGRFDAKLPFFTPNGSFWSNCTTELLANSTEADRQGAHPQPLQRRGLRIGGAHSAAARRSDTRPGAVQ